MDCSACCGGIAVDSEEHLRCTVHDCNKTYHVLCIEEKGKISQLNIASWTCPECHWANKKGGDNSINPVGVAKRHQDVNVTMRRKATRVHNRLDAAASNERNQTSEFWELCNEITKMKEQLSQSCSLIDVLTKQLERSVSVIADYDKKLKMTTSMMESYEAKMEKYADQMENLLGQLEKPGNGGNRTTSIKVTESQTQPLPSTTRETGVHDETERPLPIKAQWRPLPRTAATAPTSASMPTPIPSLLPAPTLSQSFQQSHGPETTGNEIVSDVTCDEPSELVQSKKTWTVVQHKKSRQPISLRGVAGPRVTSLKAAEPRKQLHLWNMLSEENEIKAYLNTLCPQKTITVEQLKTSNNYNSFKIGVPEDCFERCFSINVWPENARIKQWVNYKKRTPSTAERKTFRREVGAQEAA